MPVDYNNGKIYKIVCNVTNLVYIGSTCEPTLARRLSGHVKKYKAFLNQKFHFITSFKVLENNNYSIVLIELVYCNSSDELHSRERYHIETNECVNKNIPTRKIEEYRTDNKNKINKNKKEYYIKNKDKIKEKGRVNYDCGCGSTIQIREKSNHEKSLKHIKYCQTII
jgi:predicted chitinase